MRFDLLPTSTVIPAGSRLRLTLAGADPRQRLRSLLFDPPPVVSIHNLAGRSSTLSLPTRAGLRFKRD